MVTLLKRGKNSIALSSRGSKDCKLVKYRGKEECISAVLFHGWVPICFSVYFGVSHQKMVM